MATWLVERLDGSMRPSGRLRRVRSVDVTLSMDGGAPALGACTVVLDADGEFPDTWASVSMASGSARYDGVFLLREESRELNGGAWTVTASGSTVLSAFDSPVQVGSFAAAGSSVGQFASSVLDGVNVYSEPGTVASTAVFGESDTRLSALWSVLDGIGWRARLDGAAVRLEPLPSEVVRVPPSIVSENGVRRSGGSAEVTHSDGWVPHLGDLVSVHAGGAETAGRVVSVSLSSAGDTATTRIGGGRNDG